MSLQFGFPAVQAGAVLIGAAFAQSSNFIIQRPVFGALYHKAQAAATPKDVLESREAANVATTLTTSLAASALQSYAINALLYLTGAKDYKSASIVGTLVLLVSAGPQLITNTFVAKKPLDVVLSQLAVKVLDTVGVALALTAARGNAVDNQPASGRNTSVLLPSSGR